MLDPEVPGPLVGVPIDPPVVAGSPVVPGSSVVGVPIVGVPGPPVVGVPVVVVPGSEVVVVPEQQVGSERGQDEFEPPEHISLFTS